ncbi:MAG: hypothetical protein NVSMB2_11330 [Chloroflexota bacterium]
MQTTQETGVASPSPIDAARLAIWRLYQEGYVDEDMATASLLAVDLGTRRAKRQGPRGTTLDATRLVA